MSLSAEEKETVLDTPELILKDAVLKFKKLDEEAAEVVRRRRDAVTCRRKLVERARLIAGLPARVRETMARGQSFPEEGLDKLEIFSELARKALEHGSSFVLDAFLTPRVFSVGEPNPLEELVDELYPPKP